MPVFANENPPQSKTPKTSKVIYNDWRGVDYVHDAYTCERNRCPELINMISYTRGVLEGRRGYEVTKKFSDGKIHSIERGYVGNVKHTFIHCGTKLYASRDDFNYTAIYTSMPNAKTQIFFAQYQERFLIAPETPVNSKTLCYILGGGKYIYIDYNGSYTVKDVESIAYIPVVTIAAPAAGGGTVLEAVNLLQPGRIHKTYGDASAKVFQLPSKNLDATAVKVIEILESGERTRTEGAAGDLGFTVNRSTGQITFNTAPPKPPIDGTDNLFITYYKTVSGNKEKIKNCTIREEYGVGGALRCFFSGNAEFKSYDWWSEPHQPDYFPDLNYAIFGNDNTAIVGYLKFQGSLVVIKEQNNQDVTLYLRTGQISEDKTYFTAVPGMVGVGAISRYAFANVLDEPVFLSQSGVYGIISDVISQQATLQNRSYWIDPRLLNEPNLDTAIAINWDGFYLLTVNGRTYVLDMRRGEVIDRQKQGVYDGYYWEGFYPTCYNVDGKTLYFGTDQGELCKFRNTGTNLDYYDNTKAIKYVVKTKQDDDGTAAYRKSLTKKGQAISLKPYRTSRVLLSINNEYGSIANLNNIVLSASTFNFSEINFARLSFQSSTLTRPQSLRMRIKKYATLQYVLESEIVGNSFSLVAIEKSFEVTGKRV